MNALEVAGMIFNILLTLGLLAVYLEMTDTQDKQREIMDKQENLMAENHSPRMQVFEHEIVEGENHEMQFFLTVNEGEGTAENLKGGCQILLLENSEPFPFCSPMEAFNIRCFPNPLHRLYDDEELTELSGDSWLGPSESAVFGGELSFYELDIHNEIQNAVSKFGLREEPPYETDGEFGLSFDEIIDRLPIETADHVALRFFIEYEYAGGRSSRKRTPQYILTPEKAGQCKSFSEAVEKGERIHNVGPISFASSHQKFLFEGGSDVESPA